MGRELLNAAPGMGVVALAGATFHYPLSLNKNYKYSPRAQNICRTFSSLTHDFHLGRTEGPQPVNWY
jgi:hypothetical protein